MFDRESGDMLPRSAPKPSTPPNEDMFRPAVPEVSILFDKKNEKQQNAENATNDKSPQKKVQSYAAWKKQQLPQVAYPLSERQNLLPNEICINELYPMRQPMPNIQPINHMITMPMSNYYNSAPHFFNHVSSRPTTAPATTYQQQVVYPAQRRSLDAVSTINNNDMYKYASPHLLADLNSNNEVLTLCASTQTDAAEAPLSPQALRQFATKSDIDRMMDTVQQIRNDQLHVMYMLENLVVQQKQQQPQQQQVQTETRTQTNEAGTQYEQKTGCMEANMSPKPVDTETIRQNGTIPQARFHTPRLPPAAQSTGYQRNTPPGILRRSASGQPSKPTDKTMTMNELALKYLPDEKLHELMNDMQLAAPRNPIMERVMIASKAPTDMSNASYKYLKKYRLLPEEENITTKAMRFYDDDTRHSHPNSPYEPRPVDSPIILRRAASEGVNVNADRSDLIDLEDLRNKPKFM